MNDLSIDGFLGIPFGSSMTNVKEKLNQKIGSSIDELNSNSKNLFYNGIKFGGRDTMFIMFTFFEDKFCKGTVYITPSLQSQVVDIYKTIKTEINDKYFVSKQDFETYNIPYSKNDGFTETGISLGNVNFSCFWGFKSDKKEEDFISMKISEYFEVIIGYENGYLFNLLIEKEAAANSEDY